MSQESRDNIRHLQKVWEDHALDDPLWAILSWPSKRGHKWELQEFLQTGEEEVSTLFDILRIHEMRWDSAAALDFGCGVGRLTQALARRFETVSGVDISPTMIATARDLNQYADRCSYFVNATDDLRLFADNQFSFVCSNVVLQHIEPEISRRYLAEFARITKPGGLIVFQLPSGFEAAEGLPAEAWAASLECLSDTLAWPAGVRKAVIVRVRNVSDARWEFQPTRAVMLGNHWFDVRGETSRFDDGRAVLPNGIAPGGEVELALNVTTPPQPGTYTLELDLVQEGVAWFKERGSETLRLPVVISRAGGAQENRPSVLPQDSSSSSADVDNAGSDAAAGFEGFSMHVIPRDTVINVISELGLRLEHIEPSDSAGPGYVGYLYFARKPA